VANAPRTKRNAVKPAQIAKAVDEGRESLDLYLDEISRVPLLSRDEEMELARKAFRGNVAAQERLARHNVRFVVSVAKKFQNRGVPLVDLIGEGNLGLMTAARKFDPDRGVKFISYAVWWIRQAVQAAIARHGRPVRVPLNRTADLSRLGRTTTLLKERLGRMPTTEELAQRTELGGGPARPSDPRRRRQRADRALRGRSRGDGRRHHGEQSDSGYRGCARHAAAPRREGAAALFRD